MKKSMLILLIIVFVITGCSRNRNDFIKNIEIKQTAFTITDNNTQIEAEITNDNLKDIYIKNIEIVLYDENKK